MDNFGFEDFNTSAQFQESGDIGGTFEDAILLEIDGGRASGTISENTDVDYFRVDVEAGQTLRLGIFDENLGVQDAPLPASILIRNQNGEVVAQGQPAGNGLIAIEETFSQSGPLFIEVSNGGLASGVGTYDLIVESVIEAPVDEDIVEEIAGDFTTTTTLTPGETIQSDITDVGDSDFIAIDIAAGQTIDFTLDAGFFREIALVDSDGNIVAEPNLFNLGLANDPDPSFQFQAEEAGTFFYTILAVEPPSSIGDVDFSGSEYTLTATEIDDDVGNFTSNATALQGDTNIINGSFEYFTDDDAFTIELAEGDILSAQIDDEVAAGSITILGPNGLVPDNLNVLNFSSTALGPLELSLEVEALEAGTYTIIAENDFNSDVDFLSPGPGTGDYTLTTTVTSPDEEDDIIPGTGSDESFFGTRGNDFIDGGAGDDTFIIAGSNGGNDYIIGGTGRDRFVLTEVEPGIISHSVIADFRSGEDIIDVSNLDAGTSLEDLFITINGNGNVAIYISENNSVTFTNLTVVSQLSEDDFFFDTPGEDGFGTAGDDTLIGTDGDDVILGFDGDDIIEGGAGDDIIEGNAGNDTIDGGEGADDIIGGPGDDIIDGGVGEDAIDGEAGNDTISGGAGPDFIDGGPGNDFIDGGAGSDFLDGRDGDDEINGLGGDDTIFGGAGSDTLIGRDGRDFIDGGFGADFIDGGAGNDTLSGAFGDDTINGGDGDDFQIDGGDGDDVLNGNNGNDIINGGAGNDLISGGAGNDTINSEAGNDLLIGNGGSDRFIFDSDSGFDRIADFEEGKDVIDFTATDFEDFGDLNLVEQNGTVFIFIDEDSSIELTGIEDVNQLEASDFIF